MSNENDTPPDLGDDLQQDFARLDHEAQTELPGEFGQAEQPAANEPATADILFGVLQPAAGILAPNWELKDDEISQLSEAYGHLIDKYMPGGVTAWTVEINALLITAAIIVPRIGKPRIEPKEADPAKEAA